VKLQNKRCGALSCGLLFLVTIGSSLPAVAGDKKDKAKPDAAQTVDSGSFGVFIKGQRVATESFHIQQQAGNSIIKSQLKATGATDPAQKSDLEITESGELLRYEWTQSSGGSLTVFPENDFLKEKITASATAKPAEQSFLLPSKSPILDNNFFGARGMPIRLVVLVDQECAHAFLEVRMVDQADHDSIFHPHLVDEVQLVGAFLQQLEADLAGDRRFGADSGGFLGGPFVAVGRPGVERFENVLQPVRREIAVDLGQVGHDARFGDIFLAELVEDGLRAKRLGDDALLRLFEPIRREIMRCEPEAQALGAVEACACQREELREAPAKA